MESELPMLVPFTMNGKLFFGRLYCQVADLLHLEIGGCLSVLRTSDRLEYSRASLMPPPFRFACPPWEKGILEAAYPTWIRRPATNPPPAQSHS